MWDNLVFWLVAYWLQIVLAIALGIVSFITYKNRLVISLWLTDSITYGVFGKAKRLAKQHPSLIQGGWFHNEDQLCADYRKHYEGFDKSVETYGNAKRYLVNADESGRKPMPILVKVMLVAIVFVEAFGFSYVFSGKAIPGASESTQVYQGLGIAFLISLAMLWITHVAGSAYYRNSKIKKIRAHYNQDWSGKDNAPNLRRLETGLNNNDHDSESEPYLKMLNRTSDVSHDVTENKKPYWVALSAVVIVMIVAFGVRTFVYEENKTAETQGSQNYYSDAATLPNDVVETQKEADTQGKKEMGMAGDAASILTFGFLSILFALIQGMSVWISFHWGFVGVDSKEAYDLVKGFPTKEEFQRYYDGKKNHAIRSAQNQLSTLQQRMAQVFAEEGTSSEVGRQIKNRENRTFLDFLKFHDEKLEEHKARTQAGSYSSAVPKSAKSNSASDMTADFKNTAETVQVIKSDGENKANGENIVVEPTIAISDKQSKVVVPSELCGVEEASEILGVTKEDVLAALESGDLKGKKIGATYKIKRADLDAYGNW